MSERAVAARGSWGGRQLVGLQPLLLTAPLLQAIRGEAFDRHLLGLKMQAIEDLVSMPDIFMDTSYAIAMHFNLSTSQVSRCLDCPGVGWNGSHRGCTRV